MLEAENSCLRERCRALQEASDRDAARLRDYDSADMERRQLRQQMAKLQGQLAECSRVRQEAQAEIQVLLSRLAEKFDAEVVRKLPEGAQVPWLEPLQRRLDESGLLVEQARSAEVAAIAVASKAREEAAD